MNEDHVYTDEYLIRQAHSHVAYGWAPFAGSSCGGPAYTDEQKNIYLNAYFLERNKGAPISRLLDILSPKLTKAHEELARCERVYKEAVADGSRDHNWWGMEQQLKEARREIGRLEALTASFVPDDFDPKPDMSNWTNEQIREHHRKVSHIFDYKKRTPEGLQWLIDRNWTYEPDTQ